MIIHLRGVDTMVVVHSVVVKQRWSLISLMTENLILIDRSDGQKITLSFSSHDEMISDNVMSHLLLLHLLHHACGGHAPPHDA